MSAISASSGISYIYTPTTNSTSYTESLWQNPTNSSTTDSATSSDTTSAPSATTDTSSNSVSVSSQLEQLSQGILTDDTLKSTSTSTGSSYSDILKKNPLLSSNIVNFNMQQALLAGMNSSSSDSLTTLGSELNFLNNGMSASNISSVAGLLSGSSSSDIATLGEELNTLDSSTASTPTSSSTSPLNYNYSPSNGITTNSATDDSTGSNIDLSA